MNLSVGHSRCSGELRWKGKKTEKVFASLNGGVPLSVTRTVIELVPGATALVVTHEKAPLDGLMLAPAGALLKLNVKVW